MIRLKEIDGRPVFDAKQSVTLRITQADCDKASVSGIKRPEGCAVARAAHRELHVIEARVHLSRVYLRSNESNWQRYITENALKHELIAFDRGGRFEPGTFVLRAPHPSQKLGTKRKRWDNKKKGKPRQKPHIMRDVRLGPA